MHSFFVHLPALTVPSHLLLGLLHVVFFKHFKLPTLKCSGFGNTVLLQ